MDRIQKGPGNIFYCFSKYLRHSNSTNLTPKLNLAFCEAKALKKLNTKFFKINDFSTEKISAIQTSFVKVDNLIAICKISLSLNITVYIFYKGKLYWFSNNFHTSFISLHTKII